MKTMIATAAVLALASTAAMAHPVKMSDAQMDQVTAGLVFNSGAAVLLDSGNDVNLSNFGNTFSNTAILSNALQVIRR